MTINLSDEMIRVLQHAVATTLKAGKGITNRDDPHYPVSTEDAQVMLEGMLAETEASK